MDTPNIPTFTNRRTTRSILTEIPPRVGPIVINGNENPRNPAQTLAIPFNVNHSPSFSSPAPSPEELVIQQRGRRRLPVTWSPDIDETKREGPVAKDRTPVKSSLRDTPIKTSIVLRSSPRKRLLLNDPKELCLSSPEKLMKKISPTKKLRSEKSVYSLFSPNQNTNGSVNLSPGPSTPFQSALKGLSQEQLIRVFENVLTKHPHLESEIMEILPAPDIKPLEEKLMYLKKNIFKSLPNSRLTSKTDSPAYSRAATHVVAFKKCVIDQGKTLLESQHWNSVLEYVLLAWSYVKATPLWDNPPHNASRKQCFKSLAAMAISALKKGSWTDDELEEIYTRFKNCDPTSEDIQACLKQIAVLR
ncbi:hypothetical protein RUM43_011387 [Polyplax serrata]|uniref:Tethering factor for nuclear proteasome STS1 n=1 Tax=Polyplax serrata TaxID=468196 RepID=A0AAN8P769_POLSC